MLAVIADDITGAAEVAGVCMRYGLRVSFTLDTFRPADADVVVIATDTRSKSLAEAVGETRHLCEGLRKAGIEKVFKKTDSVLRGHVLQEIKAAVEILGWQKTLLIPANPDSGRIINDGIYYIHGVPLCETSFAEDPDFPARTSKVIELLTGMETMDSNIAVPDIASVTDIENHAAEISAGTLPAGSAAFFEVFLKTLYPGQQQIDSHQGEAIEGRKTLVVCGSIHDNSRRFVQEAKARLVSVIELPPALMLQDYNAETSAAAKVVAEQLLKRNTVMVAIRKEPIAVKRAAGQISKTLAQMIGKVLDHVPVGELLIEGGATAFSIIREAGFGRLTPVGELKGGVVRMKVVNEDMFLTIKPGSYSWQDNLLEILTEKYDEQV